MQTAEPDTQARTDAGQPKSHILLKRKTKVILGIIIAAVVLVALLVIAVPWNRYDAEDYFSQYERQKVNGDVEQLLLKVK